MQPSKFDPFDIIDLTYKTVNGHPIEASILTPKALQLKPKAKYPVLVYWHGGGFIIGHRLYEGWYPPWLLDLCLSSPSLIITPDYRLLPEANATDILSDVEHFWSWLHSTLPALSTTWHAQPDLSRLACAGTSAGGYLAVQSALQFPHLAPIKCIISIVGALNTDVPYYSVPGPRLILGNRAPPPARAEAVLREYVRGIGEGAVRTRGDPVEMWEFLTCMLQQAYLPRWLRVGDDERLDVMRTVVEGKGMPPIWVVQGQQDSVVVPVCATGFVEKLQRVLPEIPVLLSMRPGYHGFEVTYTTEDEWVQEGLQFVGRFWP